MYRVHPGRIVYTHCTCILVELNRIITVLQLHVSAQQKIGILSPHIVAYLHSYSVAMDTGEDEEKDYSQKDIATPIGLALTEFHCVLLFREK